MHITLLSWNVNGARAVYRNGFLPWLAQAAEGGLRLSEGGLRLSEGGLRLSESGLRLSESGPRSLDILCLQETRAEPSQLPPEMLQPPPYTGFWTHSTRRKGHSGTAILSRLQPRAVDFGIGRPEFDDEGRTIVADYGRFILINCYFPNGGRNLERVPYKLAFYEAFLAFCEGLRGQGKSLIICGDVNTSHREIDLARPKQNLKSTGFLPEERAWLDRVVGLGYVDTFRYCHPDLEGAYTWWLQWGNARERNIGWRLDYFFVTPDLAPHIVDAFILPDVKGSDHCPAGLTLELSAGG